MCTRGGWDNAHVISAEPCLSVMVRWVASSEHVADDHVSGQKVEVLQNFFFFASTVCVCFATVSRNEFDEL